MSDSILPDVSQWQEQIDQAYEDIMYAVQTYQPTSWHFERSVRNVVYFLVQNVVDDMNTIRVNENVKNANESFKILTEAVFSNVFRVSEEKG